MIRALAFLLFVFGATPLAAQVYPSPRYNALTFNTLKLPNGNPLADINVAGTGLNLRTSLVLGSAPGEPIMFGGLGSQLYMQRALIGTSDPTVDANVIRVDQDQAVVTGVSSFANYLNVTGIMTNPAAKGGRQGIQALVTQNVATASDNPNRNYVGAAFGMASFSGDGGTGLSMTSGASKGAYFGANPYVVLGCANGTCATNTLNVSGLEVNYSMRAGTSTAYKSGIQISSLPDDAVAGSVWDGALSISNQGGTPNKWSDGILFSPANGTYAVNLNGNLLRSTGPGIPEFRITTRGVVRSDAYIGTAYRDLQVAPDGSMYSTLDNNAPASGSAACSAGQRGWDPNYIYVCVATNTWRRSPLSPF